MKQSSKQQSILKRKPLKGQINRQVKFIPKQPQITSHPNNQLELKTTKSKIKQNESILNVSLIQGSSFLSNKQDGSLDSMDKMLIGVTTQGIDQKQFQEQNQRIKDQKSKVSVTDFDFNEIHKEYQKLIGRNQLLGQQQQQISDQIQQNSRVLLYQDEWQTKQSRNLQKKLQKLQKLSTSLSPKKKQYYYYSQSEIKMHLQKIQFKVDQMKYKKLQDLSNNSIKILAVNLGNLSEIHQQRQNNINYSKDTDRKRNNQQDQQDFIDFVGLPDPQQNNQNLQKKNYFVDQNQVNQWQSPMFQNLQLLLQKQKQNKKNQKTNNYQQILEALNSKQQQQIPNQLQQFFIKRQNWIKSHQNKSEQWKKKQLSLLNKMKKIMKNPQYDSDDSSQQR